MRFIRNMVGLVVASVLLLNTINVHATEPLNEIRELIRQYYVDEVSESVLSKTTTDEILKELDRYTVYMTADEFKQFTNAIEQKLVGIGVVLEEHPQGVKILSVLPGGPAERAELIAGDIITEANGKNLVGESVQSAIPYITGEEGSSVTLTIYREPEQTFTKIIVREVLNLPNVEFKMLGGNVGYIRLYSFSLDATIEIEQAIKELDGAESWIIDLRDNGGGYVSAAQEIAGFFPNVTNAFQLRYRNGSPEVYKAISQITKLTTPVHLLINGYSASASEMIAAAVKEQKSAVLYGQNTYGKGSMQGLFQLSNGGVLKLTTAKFYSPNGTPVNEVGVSPDFLTDKGEELVTSHQALISSQLSSYKKLNQLQNVPTNKEFKIKFTTKMKWLPINNKDIQLIELGGNIVDYNMKIVDDKTIKIIPKQPLKANGNYLLVVHPQFSSKLNNQMKQGVYIPVSVK